MSELQQILEELRSLRQELSTGFCESVEGWARRVSIGSPKDYEGASPWHYWDGEKPQIILQEFLKGFITKIRIDESEVFKNKPVKKLLVTVQCGRNVYELRSGFDNTWSRGFYLSVLAATPHQLQGLLSIQSRPCRDKETRKPTGSTFCTLFSGSQRIKTDYPGEQPDNYWTKIRQNAIAKFQALPRTSVPKTAYNSQQTPVNDRKIVHNSEPKVVQVDKAKVSVPVTNPVGSYGATDLSPTMPVLSEADTATVDTGKAQYIHVVATKHGWSKFGLKSFLASAFGISSGSAKHIPPEHYDAVMSAIQETPPTLHNLHGESPSRRLKAIAKTLGLKAREGVDLIKDAIAKQCGGKESWKLSESDFDAVRTKLLFLWAMQQLPESYGPIALAELLALSSHGVDGEEGDLALTCEWMDQLQALLSKAGAGAGAAV